MERTDRKKLITTISIIAALIILSEIFIFNFPSVVSFFKCVEETELNLNEALNYNMVLQDDGSYKSVSDNAYFIFYDINVPIHTIYVNTCSKNEQLNLKFSYNESTITESLRTNGRLNIINRNEGSKYSLCSFSGEVEILKLYLGDEDNSNITVESVILNKKIPFNFSIARILSIFLPAVAIAALLILKCFKNSESKGVSLRYAVAAVSAIFILIALLLSCFASNGPIKDFTDPEENQINKELVDAFKEGQVHLLREPEPELLLLENPYDRSQREQSGGSFAWDHCYYNSHYYSYYGIAPVILLFLPYNLLTGAYFPSLWAIFIFSVLGIVFLSLTYYELIKRHFSSLPIGITISGLIILHASSGIWFSLPVDNFYEIAQSSGFAFVAMGAYFLISSNAISSKKISLARAALSSVFLSLAVLCRPTLAVYCITALLFIVFGSIKAYNQNKLRSLIAYLTAALLPFVIIGSVQMIYNYLRFDSPFDFGIQYSLTINDFTAAQFHLPLTAVGFYNFILAFPKINTCFPFIHSNYNDLQLNGYYFSANETAIGIIYRALPVFAYLLSGRAYSISKNKRNALLITASCLIAPAVIIFSIWESGYGIRYCADFSWQIVIGALIIAFFIAKNSSPSIKKLAFYLMIISLVLSIAVNFALVYEYVYSNANTFIKSEMLSFGRLFEIMEIY